jgi:oligopeptide/dipeptide ABC transporter ATP-binding protein
MAVLEVKDLKVYYRTLKGYSKAVDGVSFQIDEDEYLGLVGESGCGKSTIAKAILRILPVNGEIVGGEIRYKGRDILSMKRGELKKIQWKEISMIPQSAMNSFDPVYRIEYQMMEAIKTHEKIPQQVAQAKIEELFSLVGLNKSRLKDYPHQFSGGMRQRAMIAMSLVLDPTLIVADEPTTGLDVIVQDQILVRIKEIHEKLKKTMLLITHNMAVVAENCSKIAVMYAGKIMEYGGKTVFLNPYHPYTLGLINAFPSLDDTDRELLSIPGSPPSLLNPPEGCRFHQRCPFSTDQCVEEEPSLRRVEESHFSACHYPDQVEKFRDLAQKPATWQSSIKVREGSGVKVGFIPCGPPRQPA